MKMKIGRLAIVAILAAVPATAFAQYRTVSAEEFEAINAEQATATQTRVLTLEEALEIALSENETVKVADMEVERVGYAKKGTYASLFPSVDASGSFMRTIKKQVMYMDFDMSALTGGSSSSGDTTGDGTGIDYSQYTGTTDGTDSSSSSNSGGFEVGRWNTFSGGLSASMPLVNFQLWQSLKISGMDVELAVEKARSSRLEMVTQVKQAYYAVLLSKEALDVYKSVYDNAMLNYEKVERKYNAQKASELEYTRAKANVANAIPNVYNSESSVILGLWQLKAVMGVDLDMDIDVAGSLSDYADTMFKDIHDNDNYTLTYNSTMRQLAIQADELAEAVRTQKYAYLPTLAASFSYTMNAMTNDFKFSTYRWTPYSYVGLSLSIPIFSGGKRLNNVRQSQVQSAELDLQRNNTERQLKIAIRQYLNTMEANMKSYASAQQAVDLAQKAYDISAKSFEVGKSTLTDLNDSQLTLTQSKLSESQAIYNFMVAKSNLEQTLGYDFIDPDGTVNLDAKISE